nr:MAG TPA: hypothetical protein [Caudoviricetes sp.]
MSSKIYKTLYFSLLHSSCEVAVLLKQKCAFA